MMYVIAFFLRSRHILQIITFCSVSQHITNFNAYVRAYLTLCFAGAGCTHSSWVIHYSCFTSNTFAFVKKKQVFLGYSSNIKDSKNKSTYLCLLSILIRLLFWDKFASCLCLEGDLCGGKYIMLLFGLPGCEFLKDFYCYKIAQLIMQLNSDVVDLWKKNSQISRSDGNYFGTPCIFE